MVMVPLRIYAMSDMTSDTTLPGWAQESSDAVNPNNHDNDECKQSSDQDMPLAEQFNGVDILNADGNRLFEMQELTLKHAPIIHDELATQLWEVVEDNTPWYLKDGQGDAFETCAAQSQIELFEKAAKAIYQSSLFTFKVGKHILTLNFSETINCLIELNAAALSAGFKTLNGWRHTYVGAFSLFILFQIGKTALSYCFTPLVLLYNISYNCSAFFATQSHSHNLAMSFCWEFSQYMVLHYMFNMFEIFENPAALTSLFSQIRPWSKTHYDQAISQVENLDNDALTLLFSPSINADNANAQIALREIGNAKLQRLLVKGADLTIGEKRCLDEVMAHPAFQRELGLLRIEGDPLNLFAFLKHSADVFLLRLYNAYPNFADYLASNLLLTERDRQLREHARTTESTLNALFENDNDIILRQFKNNIFNFIVVDQCHICNALFFKHNDISLLEVESQKTIFRKKMCDDLKKYNGDVESYFNAILEAINTKEDEAFYAIHSRQVDNFAKRFIMHGKTKSELKRIARLNYEQLESLGYFGTMQDFVTNQNIQKRKEVEIKQTKAFIKDALTQLILANCYLNVEEACSLEDNINHYLLMDKVDDVIEDDFVIANMSIEVREIDQAVKGNRPLKADLQSQFRRMQSHLKESPPSTAAERDAENLKVIMYNRVRQSFSDKQVMNMRYVPHNRIALLNRFTAAENQIVDPSEEDVQPLKDYFNKVSDLATLSFIALYEHDKAAFYENFHDADWVWQFLQNYKSKYELTGACFSPVHRAQGASLTVVIEPKDLCISQEEVLYYKALSVDEDNNILYSWRSVLAKVEEHKNLLKYK